MTMLFARWLVAACFIAYPCLAQDLAIRQATVYTNPQAPPLHHATVLVIHGRITSVGPQVQVPAGIRSIDCQDCFVTAGFWNAHVHFTEQKWFPAAALSKEQLASQLREMLTGSGFSTVVDTASDPTNTTKIRSRINSGEVVGPRIFTAGAGIYPPHGIPFYLSDLPAEVRAKLPQPNTPEEAASIVRQMHALGADLTKLFTGSWVQHGHVLPMPVPIAKAAAEQAHVFHQLVFAHPSNLAGIQVAIDAGVDVLAHAPDATEGVTDEVIKDIIVHHMAMIPTLKLFSGESSIAQVREIVAAFHREGGQLIFGTDTGFVTDYNLAEEYRQLALCGLNFSDVLSMLTTNPVQRFGLSKNEGQVAAGFRGDLTILAPGKEAELGAFTRVRYVIRNGVIIFGSAGKPE